MKKLIRPSALFALLALGLTCASCSFNVDTSGAIAVYEDKVAENPFVSKNHKNQ